MPREDRPNTSVHASLSETDLLVNRIEKETSGFDLGPPKPPRDAQCRVAVSPDRMSATADFIPAVGQGHPLTFERFLALLAGRGVVYGVTVTAESDLTGVDVLVAEGRAAVPALPERTVVVPELLRLKKALDSRAVFFDFKDQSPFIQVHHNDVLARRLAPLPGVPGRTVGGTEVAPSSVPTARLSPGKNIVLDDDEFRARCDGHFQLANNRFWVDQVLFLDEGVGYATGHIEFDGDVRLRGDVSAGFQIHIQGALHSSGSIDVSEVICGGEVVTPEGIIGRPGSVLRAGGSVRARFVENAWVVTPRPLEIGSSVMNSRLQTRDRLVMGPRGVILGGVVEAQNGVEVYQTGNSQGTATRIVCGMDYQTIEKMQWVRTQSLLLVGQLKALEGHRMAVPDQMGEVNKACSKVRTQLLKLNEMSRRLVSLIDRNEDAQVVVRGTAFAGTSIEICHVVRVLTRSQSRVRFSLDKAKGTIREDAL